MKKLYVLVLWSILISSCNDKIIREEITTKDMKLTSYYYSYITNISHTYVEIEINNKTFLIAEGPNFHIIDISLSNDTIYINRSLRDYVQDDEIHLEGRIYNYVIKYNLISPF